MYTYVDVGVAHIKHDDLSNVDIYIYIFTHVIYIYIYMFFFV